MDTLDSAYKTWKRNWTGSIEYTNFDPAFTNLIRLEKMRNEGKTSAEIQNQAQNYWNNFKCGGNKIRNEALSQNVMIEFKGIPPYDPSVSIFIKGPLYQIILTYYSEFLGQIKQNFREYMNYGKSINYELNR